MKDQIEKLKTELREFLELSKTITGGECKIKPYEYAVFVMRSRNISPALAECLLSQIEWLEQYAIPVESANQQLQQILTIWEASK